MKDISMTQLSRFLYALSILIATSNPLFPAGQTLVNRHIDQFISLCKNTSALKESTIERLYELIKVSQMRSMKIDFSIKSQIISSLANHIANKKWEFTSKENPDFNLATLLEQTHSEMVANKILPRPIALTLLYLYQQHNATCNGIIDTCSHSTQDIYYVESGDFKRMEKQKSNHHYIFLCDKNIIAAL